MSDQTETETVARVQVTFGVDVPTEEIEALRNILRDLNPGTTQYCSAWDRLKALHVHFVGRLDGECNAYMNIAKDQARQLFDM